MCLAVHRPGVPEKFTGKWKKLKHKVDDAIRQSKRHGRYVLTKAQQLAKARAGFLAPLAASRATAAANAGAKDGKEKESVEERDFIVIYEGPSEMDLQMVVERGALSDESFDCKCYREKMMVKDPPMGPAWKDMALPIYEWGEEKSSSSGDHVVAVLWVHKRPYDAEEAEAEGAKIERMKELWEGDMKNFAEKSKAFKKYESRRGSVTVLKSEAERVAEGLAITHSPSHARTRTAALLSPSTPEIFKRAYVSSPWSKSNDSVWLNSHSLDSLPRCAHACLFFVTASMLAAKSENRA